MNEPEDRSKSYAGRAWIDMTSVVIMVEAAPLAAYLASRHPLAIRAFPDAPSGKHPVCVELWRVRDGRSEASGLDQHEWLARSGGVVGAALGSQTGAMIGSTYGAAVAATMGGLAYSWLGPLGVLWGASAGFVAGAASGGLAGASAGRTIGEEMLGRTAREASEIAARTFGTYHEAAVLVPNAVRADGSGPPHQFVLGMLTDSPLSKLEADVFGQGFSKQVATARCTPFREWQWRNEGGAPLLEARFDLPGTPMSPSEVRASAMLAEWTSTPFLGCSVAGDLVATDVDRMVDEGTGLVVAGSGEVIVAPGFSDAIGRGRYDLGEQGSGGAAAFHAGNTLVRVSRPRALDT